MTDTIIQNTDTVEGLVSLLRGRLARGERPTQNGDSFPMFTLMEAMNIVHDEMLDQEELALCVLRLKTVLACEPGATLSGFTPQYKDAAFRVINREQALAQETGDPD